MDQPEKPKVRLIDGLWRIFPLPKSESHLVLRKTFDSLEEAMRYASRKVPEPRAFLDEPIAIKFGYGD